MDSIQKRGLLETLRRVEQNALWDVMDAAPAKEAPLTGEALLPADAPSALASRILNQGGKRQGQAELWATAKALTPGTYGMRLDVGKAAEGTAHPHFFVVDRDETSATFLFVDPEHYLNRTKRAPGHLVREADVRPKVCNLMAVRLVQGKEPDIAIVRFRTNELTPADVSFERQLAVARDLFLTRGFPPMLEGKEKELVMRLVIAPSSGQPALLQARYAKDAEELTAFLRGEKGSSFLEGKVRAAAALMTEFSVRLGRGEFSRKQTLERKA